MAIDRITNPQARDLTASDDVESFERLIRGADERLRAVVFRLVGGDVDDVMQNAYLRAFRHWSRFRGESTRGTWLHRIAVNAALDHLRGRRRRDERSSLLGRAAAVGDIGADVAVATDLERAIDGLPVDQRIVLVLVDGQGFSHDEVAVIVGAPVGTVGSRLSRARRSVRQSMQGGH